MIQDLFLELPSFIDRVEISQFSLGDKYPMIKSCRYCNDRAEIALEFNDKVSIRIETQLLINWPKPGKLTLSYRVGTASLPVTLDVSLIEFSATVYACYNENRLRLKF